MQSFELIIVEQAIIEMEDAYRFYDARADNLGTEFSEEVFEVLDKVLLNPFLFPIKFKEVHEAVLNRFPYTITYEIVDNKVVVLSVFHTKRYPNEKLRRKR